MLPLSPTSRSLIEQLQSLGGGAQTRFERVTTICKIKPQAIVESPQFHSDAKSKTPESQSSRFAQTPDSFNSKLLLSTERQNTYIQLSSKEFSLKVEEKFRDGSEFNRKRQGLLSSLSFAVDRVIDPLYVRESLQQILLMKGSDLNLLDYLWKGFNVSLITFGDSGSGKSHSVFQKEDGLSILDQLVHGLFSQIERERLASQSTQQGGGDPSQWSKYLVGFTMFEIQYRSTPGVKKVEYVVDLLNSSNHDNTDGELLNVIVATEFQLMKLLESGMRRSKNFDRDGKKILKNKAHLFLRIMLYDTEQHQISTFHLVDMIGNHNSFKLTDDPMEMGVSSGLAAFKQMVAEMARQCKKNERFPKLKASRHSKLTQLVSPLLCGNSKSIILGCVSNDSKYENICGTMDLLEKAAEISVQLRRNDTVKRKELSFVYFSSYAQRHLSSLQRETRSKTTPHKAQKQKTEETETVTVADLQEQSLQKVQKTYEWINDFQEKKEERLKEAVEEAK